MLPSNPLLSHLQKVAEEGGASKKALLISLNSDNLRGAPWVSVGLMQNCLTKFGYKSRVIKDDDPHNLPTSATIIVELEQLKEKATKGDNVVLFYNGHSAVKDNEVSLSIKGKEDYISGKYLVKLANDIGEICNMTVILDTCLARSYFKDSIKKNEEKNPTHGLVVFTSSDTNQYSKNLDVRKVSGATPAIGEERAAIFTHFFCEEILNRRAKNNEELIEKTRSAVRKFIAPDKLDDYNKCEMECSSKSFCYKLFYH